MTDLHEKLLGLLKEIDVLCRENDVDYYLTAGTLLGAVRHRGFIPWDDDADVIMSRDNWEKFLERTRGKLPEGRRLNTQYDNAELAMTANHYVDIGSTAIYRYDLPNPEQTGIMVDIIIMDPVPDNSEAKEEYITALTEHTELTTLAYQYSLRLGKPTHFTHYWAKSQRRGKKAVLNEIDKVAFSYDEETAGFYVQRFAGSPHFWPKEYYGKPRYVPFEDTTLPIPQRAEDCLAIGFDEEWMLVPSAGDLKSIHEYCIRSMSVPVENITGEFRCFFDQKTVLKTYVKKKRIWEHITEGRIYQAFERDKFVAARLQMVYSRKREEEDFRKYLSDGDYEALNQYFEEYISLQCNSRCLGSSSLTGWLNWSRKCWPYLIDIGDEELYVVLLLVFRKQKLTWVERLLKARKAIERPMTEELLAVEQLFDAVQKARSHYYCKEWVECRAIVDTYLPLWPDNSYLYILDLQLKWEESDTFVELAEALETGLSLFPEDAELLELKANVFFESGKAEEALLIFQELVKTTNHGLVLMHMQDKMEHLIEENPLARDYYALWLKIRNRRGETELPKLDNLCPRSMLPKSLKITVMEEVKEQDPAMARLDDDIQEARSHFECGEWDECRAILDRYIPLCLDNPNLYKLDLQLKLKEDHTAANLEEIIETGLSLFPEDAELLELKANWFFENSNVEDALLIYQELVETTKQGIVLMRMQDKMEQLLEENPLARDYYALWLKIRKKRGEKKLPKLDNLCPLSMASKSLQIMEMNENEEIPESIYIKGRGVEKTEGSEESMDSEDSLAHLNGIQKKRFELLLDLEDLCKKNEIEYFLLSKGLWMAVRTQKYTDPNADIVVAMTPENVQKFIKAVEATNNPNRYIDSMATNPYFHRFTIRYCDRNSLDIAISKCLAGGNCKNLFGIFITVEILRSPAENKRVDQFQQMIELGWEASVGGKINSRIQKLGKNLIDASCIMLGRMRTAKMIYRFLMHIPKKVDEKRYYIEIFEKGREYYPKHYFDYTNQVVLEGYKFFTIKMYEEYLTAKFGANWTKKPPTTKILPTSRVIDADITGSDFIAYIDTHGIDRKSYWKNFRKTEKLYSPVKKLNKDANWHWRVMCACGEHYRLYDQYIPNKDFIMELYQNDDVKRLNKVLDDYIKASLSFSSQGLNVDFDKQITMVMDYVLLCTNRKEKLNELRCSRKENPMPPINENYKIT